MPDQEEVTAIVTVDLTDFGVAERDVPAERETTDVTERVLQQVHAGTA